MREDIELTVAQASEALMRADRRNNSMQKGCETVSWLLEEFEEKGAPVRSPKDAEEVEELNEEERTKEDLAAGDQVPEV